MSNVFNNFLGDQQGFDFTYPQLTLSQKNNILASLFEQLLIFDKITICTNRLNFPLVFLIDRLGINTVERLLRSGYIQFLIWSPVIVTGYGRIRKDGTTDESTIYGQPPIASGSLSAKDLDPEYNIHTALSNFYFHKDRKRIFTRLARKNYIVPDGMTFSADAAKIIIDAYKSNNLVGLGLPYDAEPDQLNLNQRGLLLELGHKVLESAVLSKYNLKSFENFEHYSICKQNLENIGKAYNVVNNTSEILRIENIPDLKKLYISQNFTIDSIFKLRHLSTAKYFRNWINSVGENSNAQEVSEAYINEVKGKGRYFNSKEGKLIRNIGVFGIGAGLSSILTPITGVAAGLGLGLLDTFWLENILKGQNPSMFIDLLKTESINQE